MIDRKQEEFYGARKVGWTLMIMSMVMILGIGVISIWDGFRSDFTFWQFFFRFIFIFTTYKIYDMIFFDYFLLCKFHFFQTFTPEVTPVYTNRKYGYNIKSQLLKLLVIFPAACALAAWIKAIGRVWSSRHHGDRAWHVPLLRRHAAGKGHNAWISENDQVYQRSINDTVSMSGEINFLVKSTARRRDRVLSHGGRRGSFKG